MTDFEPMKNEKWSIKSSCVIRHVYLFFCPEAKVSEALGDGDPQDGRSLGLMWKAAPHTPALDCYVNEK